MFIFPILTKYLMAETGWQNTLTVFGCNFILNVYSRFFLKKPENEITKLTNKKNLKK